MSITQLRGQRRNITRWRRADDKTKSARAEDLSTSQTGSAVLQDLTHETSGRQLGSSERLKEMREMSTLHEHQLALIHAHNQELEQQRDELAHQMSVLSEQCNRTHLESLLMRGNEEILQQLSEHPCASHEQEVSVHANQPDPRNSKKMHHDSYELISSADGPLSTQINRYPEITNWRHHLGPVL
ncbi:uncharacterized protein ccdc17 [Cebidichthys violaceus]|uniref:uncharacterized protein ccdc17 n=1 Tax=Cebidichthys violaceus TaxID=271503 RepID=UPI0035CACA41